ncbi:hypothetical protein DESC_780030 [Desulfosarcina cetonica]|nr:hypothetical protein DESC_780030 [Desulfosarcina cetonica]
MTDFGAAELFSRPTDHPICSRYLGILESMLDYGDFDMVCHLRRQVSAPL